MRFQVTRKDTNSPTLPKFKDSVEDVPVFDLDEPNSA
jgi:hypothetical protein